MGGVRFPVDALVGRDTALCLFAAAFGGENDAVFLRNAGLVTTCVDIDRGKLDDMVPKYPDTWEFIRADAFDYAAGCDREWDVVTVDCPTQLFDRCAAFLPIYCELADVVILGSGGGHADVPDGWHIKDVYHRSNFKGGVYWLEIQHDRVAA